MTVRDKLQNMLMQNGLSGEDSKTVMDLAIPKISQSNPAIKWNDPLDGYPPFLCNTLYHMLKVHAFEWISENQPLAWYKEMYR